MASAEGPLEPGDQVGKYLIRTELGRGGSAVVYDAEHEAIGHGVAIKVLRPELRTDRSARARFARETRLSASVRSEHVPQVHDVDELPSGLPYIVMERLRGATLAEWLGAHRRLPVPVAVEIGIQLGSALVAVHARRAVHRDIKPGNVVLHEEADGRHTVKLVDFGICIPVDEGSERRLTLPGRVVGTPEYMSPEQLRGLPVDSRSDVYSLGVVLYEMLSGRCPHLGGDANEVGRSVLSEEPIALLELCPECPRALDKYVRWAMAKRPEDRPESAQELRDALERFSDTRALQNHPVALNRRRAVRDGAGGRPPSQPARSSAAPRIDPPKLPPQRSAVAGWTVALLTLTGAAYGIGMRGHVHRAPPRAENGVELKPMGEAVLPARTTPAPRRPRAPVTHRGRPAPSAHSSDEDPPARPRADEAPPARPRADEAPPARPRADEAPPPSGARSSPRRRPRQRRVRAAAADMRTAARSASRSADPRPRAARPSAALGEIPENPY